MACTCHIKLSHTDILILLLILEWTATWTHVWSCGQAGFQKDRSTCDQVAALTTFIENRFQQNLKTGAVFLALTAAYDIVWHTGLLYKLSKSKPYWFTRLVGLLLRARRFMASSALQHWTASPTKKGCHWQAGEENRQTWQLPIQPDILSPPLLRLTSRKPLWLDLQSVDIKSRWRHNWKSAQMVNSHLECDPTIRQPGFNLPWQQWSLLNSLRTEQGHCGACRKKWRLTDTDLCLCVKNQTMSHIVESCPLTKLNGGLSRLHTWT